MIRWCGCRCRLQRTLDASPGCRHPACLQQPSPPREFPCGPSWRCPSAPAVLPPRCEYVIRCCRVSPQSTAEGSAAAETVTAFAIAYGALQLVYGPIGDRYGKYRIIIVATLASALTSLACAL